MTQRLRQLRSKQSLLKVLSGLQSATVQQSEWKEKQEGEAESSDPKNRLGSYNKQAENR